MGREPCAKADMLCISHQYGKVRMTSDHMIFVQQSGSSKHKAIFAREVQIGDRLLAPWIDGGLSSPEVTSIGWESFAGLYAPFLGSGALVVDGAVVSCYAIPRHIAEAELPHCLCAMFGAHALAHLSHLPLRRFLERTATSARTNGSLALQRQQT